MKKRTTLSWGRLRELGVAAQVDPRTIEKVLAGEHVKGTAGERATAILIKEGLLTAGTPKTPGVVACAAPPAEDTARPKKSGEDAA